MNKTITLNVPVEYKNGDAAEKLTSLTIKQRTRVCDQIAAVETVGMNRAALEAYLIATSCGVPYSAICKVDMNDFERLVTAYSDFMETPPTTA